MANTSSHPSYFTESAIRRMTRVTKRPENKGERYLSSALANETRKQV